jgi:hypothetical protein
VAKLPNTRVQTNALRALRNPTANVTAEALDAIQTALDGERRDLDALLAAIPLGTSASADTVAYGPCAATLITDAQLVDNPDTGEPLQYIRHDPGIWLWNLYGIRWTRPQDRNYWFSFVTYQKGHVDSGTGAWVPAADDEGRDEAPGLYYGRELAASGAAEAALPTGATGIIEWRGNVPPDLKMPPAKLLDGSANPDITYRLWMWCVSVIGKQAAGSAGAITLETFAWPGALDHLDVTPTPQSPALDAERLNPATLGDGVGIALGKLAAKVTSGLEFDGTGHIKVKNGSGIAFDGSGNVTVNPGVGLQIDGSGFLTVKPGTGLTADAGGVYIPGGAITNALLAALSVATAQLQDNSVTSAKVYSLDTAKLYAGVAKIGTALIANGAITNALLGNAVVGTANIQNAAITNALVNDLGVSKLTAGTATFSGDVTLSRGSGKPSIVLANSDITLYTVDTNTAYPYLRVTGSALSIHNGNYVASIGTTAISLATQYGTFSLTDLAGGGMDAKIANATRTANIAELIIGTALSGMNITSSRASGSEYDGAYFSLNGPLSQSAALVVYRDMLGLVINANPVVGPRRTGWSACTGTKGRTGFDTATATVGDVAQRLAALIDDLLPATGHGLIGA